MITGRAREVQHHMRRRLVVKPGITRLWQINGRSDLPWDEAVRLDLRYAGNWPFARPADPLEDLVRGLPGARAY
jgi:lipopolysaccharide/colanic/teichoic acid biosynthesis glycosyltransferase